MAANWKEWVGERFGLKEFWATAMDRRVAKGKWYQGDGAALTLLLGVLVATGAMMTLTYSPSPDGAHESLVYLTNVQVLGWFIRGLHYWSAGMMVVMLFWHVLRQILIGGYKSPREGTWLVGVGLFFLVTIMAFTGYTLRWDETAIYATRVVLHMIYNIPWIGEPLVLFVQGGPEPGARMLTRFYAVHTIFVPLLIGLLVIWHLYLIILHGVTSNAERRQAVQSAAEQKVIYNAAAHSEEQGETFFPETIAKSGAMALVVFGIVLALVLLIGPPRIEEEANLLQPSLPAEEWWFWWVSGLIGSVPPVVAQWMVVLLPLAIFAVLVLLPFLDRGPYRGISKRKWAAALVLVLVILLVFFSDLRRRSPWTGWPKTEPPPIPEGIIVSPAVLEGRLLFAKFGCNSCHSVAGHGRDFAVDLADIRERRSPAELRRYILNPPPGVAMPSYEQHLEENQMTEEELERLVEFVLAAQTFPKGGR